MSGAPTYTHRPTTTAIADHLDAGGIVERRSTPGGPWVYTPQAAQRPWRSFPDQSERWATYRLVHPV